jgi:hypothetical protein
MPSPMSEETAEALVRSVDVLTTRLGEIVPLLREGPSPVDISSSSLEKVGGPVAQLAAALERINPELAKLEDVRVLVGKVGELVAGANSLSDVIPQVVGSEQAVRALTDRLEEIPDRLTQVVFTVSDNLDFMAGHPASPSAVKPPPSAPAPAVPGSPPGVAWAVPWPVIQAVQELETRNTRVEARAVSVVGIRLQVREAMEMGNPEAAIGHVTDAVGEYIRLVDDLREQVSTVVEVVEDAARK